MMAVAAKSYPGLTFRQQDAENLTVTGTFDAVFSNAALHWMDVGKVFPQLARVLRAGGRFVAELGGLHNIMTIERAIYDALAAMGLNPEKFPRPWRFPPPSELALKLEQAGFEVRYMHLYDRSTLLAAETGGIKGWVRMFGRAFLDKLPPDRQETFLGLIEDETRSSLYRDGQWYADYRRQHFIAAKL
jgi:trans-aconitate 2-methyltransferase